MRISRLHNTRITGEFTVHTCDVQHKLRTIDVRVIRVEMCGMMKVADGQVVLNGWLMGYLNNHNSLPERSEVQTTQIADGDVCRGLAIPIYVLLPPHYTCTSLETPNFSVQFELQFVVTMDNYDTRVIETFPLTLVR